MNHSIHGKVGADSLLPPPKSLQHGCNSMPDLHIWCDLVYPQALEIIWKVISWIVEIWRVSWEKHPSVTCLSANESTSSLRSWTESPVSLASTLWDEGVGEALLRICSPLSSILTLSHGSTEVLSLCYFTTCTEVTGWPNFYYMHKGLAMFPQEL